MDKDEKLAFFAAASVIVAAIIGPFVVESYQRDVELRNEAFAIHNEISRFQSRWIHVRDERMAHYTSTSPEVLFPDVIYPKSGLYFVYGKDIYRFSPELSTELAVFYEDVTAAESYREDLIQFVNRTSHPLEVTFTTDTWKEYDKMMGCVVEAVNISQEGVLNRLEQVYSDP